MPADPRAPFTHIHCSSRFDRPADRLESDLDDWMSRSSLITVTEVGNNGHASRLREKGWSYFNSKLSQGQDDCAIAWDKSVWHMRRKLIRKLSVNTFQRGKARIYLYSCSVVLKRVSTGHVLLVSVTHFPAHIQGTGGFSTQADDWAARKRAYLSGLNAWATHAHDTERKVKADGTLFAADWNLNLKDRWVQNLLLDRFGKAYDLGWKHFPTSGGSLAGGPEAPAGAPGKGRGDRIIDGSLIRGLVPTDEPDLMSRVASSDHRPYKESYRFAARNETPTHTPSHGDVHHGDEWWGFGDYMDDEIYDITRVYE